MDSMEYFPGVTFAKGAQLVDMAMRDPAVADTLMKGSKEEKLKLFAEVGLSEDEFKHAVGLINRHFGNPIQTAAIFW